MKVASSKLEIAVERNMGTMPPAPAQLRIPRQSLIERPRLLSRLALHDRTALIVVKAPAGYGKTSLLQQWAGRCAQEGSVIAWLSLDPRDRDPMFFATHLNAALEAYGIAIGGVPGGTAGSLNYYGWQPIIRQICNRFIEDPRPCRIIIDDVHQIADSDAAVCLQTLLNEAPPEIQVIIATRGETGLPLGSIRAHKDVVELDGEDLRFREDETLAFLADRAQHVVDEQQVKLLHKRSEGWIVGIKLFSMALNLEPENQKILESFTGERRQIAEFFVEDVFSRLADDLQSFLLHTSLLDRFCPALCDAAMDIGGSRELIDRCEAAGLFLQPLDETQTWYRYHHLFADFLRRQLHDREPAAIPRIYRRAALWLTESGNHVEAFNCAMSGRDPLFAADMLDANCEAMFAAGLQPTVQHLASHLPPHIQALYPRLLLSLAWRACAQWRLADARSLVAVAERRVEDMALSSTVDETEVDGLRQTIKHRKAQIAHASYEVDRLEGQCQSALDDPNDFASSPYLLASYQNSLQYAQREQFKLARIDRIDALAREQVMRTGVVHGEVFIAGTTGPSLLLMGQTQRAKEVMRDALEIAIRIAGEEEPLCSVVATALAATHYERNEIAEARLLIDRFVPKMTSAGFVDQLVHGWLTQARLQFLDGDADGCINTLDGAAQFASSRDLDSLRTIVNAERLRILLKLGRPDDAARFARSRGLTSHRAAALGRRQFAYTALDSTVALANCRLLAADDRFGDALAMARHWRSFVTAAQAAQHAVEWGIMVAELLALSGDRLAAQRALQQALDRAVPGRFIRRFVDAGEPVGGILRQMIVSEGAVDKVSESLLAEIVDCFEPVETETDDEGDEDDIAICGRITSREIEILTLAGAGLLNRQIGDQLGLTEGTVKWYLQQVYDKVGIRNRKKAVVRVRRLGLIP